MTESLPRRGYVGLQVAPVPETAPQGPGLYVRSVAAGSSAERAGAQVADRLIAIDGQAVTDMNTVRRRLRELRVGEPLAFSVLRAGVPVSLEGTVQPFPLEQHTGAQVLLDEVRVGAHRLRAIALLPDTQGPHPVVYYLPGAHWASEEYPFAPLHPVPALLGELARLGIASLRVDRSGMGDSEGPACNDVDFETEYAGYRAGYERLTQSAWCDPTRIVLLGHSLGAMVAPLLARDASVTPAALVTFGASAIPIAQGLTGALQRYAALQANVAPDVVARQCELLRLIAEGRQTPAQVLAARPDLRAITPDHFTDSGIYRRSVSFYHQLQQQALVEAWTGVSAPVLAIHGTADWICTLQDSARIASLAQHVEVAEVAADHQMSDARSPHAALGPTGTPDVLSLRISRALAACVTSWVTARVKAP